MSYLKVAVIDRSDSRVAVVERTYLRVAVMDTVFFMIPELKYISLEDVRYKISYKKSIPLSTKTLGHLSGHLR